MVVKDNNIEVVDSKISSDSEFVDASQVVERVSETQTIVAFERDKVKDFLEKSLANMADLDNEGHVYEENELDEIFK